MINYFLSTLYLSLFLIYISMTKGRHTEFYFRFFFHLQTFSSPTIPLITYFSSTFFSHSHKLKSPKFEVKRDIIFHLSLYFCSGFYLYLQFLPLCLPSSPSPSSSSSSMIGLTKLREKCPKFTFQFVFSNSFLSITKFPSLSVRLGSSEKSMFDFGFTQKIQFAIKLMSGYDEMRRNDC